MIGLKDLLLKEVNKALQNQNIKGLADFLGNELVITIPSSEAVNIMMSGFPENLRPAVKIECGDIKIKIKVI